MPVSLALENHYNDAWRPLPGIGLTEWQLQEIEGLELPSQGFNDEG
ncbi:MAG: hypothetical protein Q7T65_05735 [Thiobacillus sp.]|nr:hypothetical protein [Thiobacillus sp.]